MPDLDLLFPGRFTKGKTLEHPITIRILSVNGELLEGDDGAAAKAIMRYRTAGPDGQPVEAEIVFNKTNALLTAAALGTRDFTQWGGRLVTIGFDDSVMLGREKVGGIRVVGSPELKKALEVSIKRPRRKKAEIYKLYPTDVHGRRRDASAPQPSAPPAEAPPPQPEPDREVGQEG